jgi:hypothetical protein
VVIVFVIAALWALGVLIALMLSVASRKLDGEIALERQLTAVSATRTDLAV